MKRGRSRGGKCLPSVEEGNGIGAEPVQDPRVKVEGSTNGRSGNASIHVGVDVSNEGAVLGVKETTGTWPFSSNVTP